MARVRVLNGPAKGQVFEVTEKPLSVGRDVASDIQVLDKGVSRAHAEIFRIGEMCFIRDHKSRNGTFVNDVRVEEELLRHGDRVQVGATILFFDDAGASAAADVTGEGLEFSDGEIGTTVELRLEDLSAWNVGEGDGSEAKRLRALYQLGRMLAEERSEEALIQRVLPFVAEETSADAAYLFMRDPEQGAIRPAGQHVPEGRRGGRISRTIIRRAIQEGRALLTSDAMQDSRFSSRESILMKQIHSVICVPVAVLGEFTGVLYLAADEVQNMFTEDQLELVAAFADQIGLATSHLRMRQRERESLMSTIRALVRAAELRNPQRRGHSERVASYAVAVARHLRLKPEQIQNIRLAALLHDVGQIGEEGEVPRDDEDEAGLSHDQLRVRHTLEIIRDMACYGQIESAIRYQLERMDGSGPSGLRGRDIPLEARILAASTLFDNRVFADPDRPRREAARDALVALRERAGAKLDEEVVAGLAAAYEQGRIDFAAPDYGPTDSEWNPAPRSQPDTEPEIPGPSEEAS